MVRRPSDPRQAAEAAFKAATTRPVEPLARGPAEPLAKGPAEPVARSPSPPGTKEQVSLRIDRDVLDYFQEQGPGWQDRINAALRKAAGK